MLDFGGVIVESNKGANWEEKIADFMAQDCGLGTVLDPARIVADVRAGSVGAKLWKNAASRLRYPEELTQETYVLEFIAADWPLTARTQLIPHIPEICYRVGLEQEQRKLRRGILELLTFCRHQRLPVSIVSNALSGQLHRDYLAENGLSEFFVTELYSDEVQMRKPNPRFLELGARSLGLSSKDCWYVGDHKDRDVLCGLRAGIGANILMPVPGAAQRPFEVFAEPDLTVADPQELLTIMKDIIDTRTD